MSKHAKKMVEAIRPVIDSVVRMWRMPPTVLVVRRLIWRRLSLGKAGSLRASLRGICCVRRGDAEAVLAGSVIAPAFASDNRDHARASRELMQRASEKEQRFEDLLEMEMAAALVTVLGEDKRPQAHRFGQALAPGRRWPQGKEPPGSARRWSHRWGPRS